MKTYNVHLYREMCLFFPVLSRVRQKMPRRLLLICPQARLKRLKIVNGENLAALVGVVSREDCKQNWMIDFDPVRAIAPDLLTVLTLALPILQEAVRTHLLSDNSTARIALDRVVSVIAKAHVKTA